MRAIFADDADVARAFFRIRIHRRNYDHRMNTPPDIHNLMPNQIFVFGSNTNGVHGKGAARTAADLFGAVRGIGEGRTGQCYAIPTRRMLPHQFGQRGFKFETLSLEDIGHHVGRFLAYTRDHPELQFLVTLIGCGYAGYRPEQIKPMFARRTENVIVPVEFV